MTILTWGFIVLALLGVMGIQNKFMFKGEMVDNGVVFSNAIFVLVTILAFVFLDKHSFIGIVLFTFGLTGLRGFITMVFSMNHVLKYDKTKLFGKLLWIPTIIQLFVTYISLAIYFDYIAIPSAFQFYCHL